MKEPLNAIPLILNAHPVEVACEHSGCLFANRMKHLQGLLLLLITRCLVNVACEAGDIGEDGGTENTLVVENAEIIYLDTNFHRTIVYIFQRTAHFYSLDMSGYHVLIPSQYVASGKIQNSIA